MQVSGRLPSKSLAACTHCFSGAYEVFLSIHTGAVPVPIPVGSIDEVFGEGMIPTLEEGLRNAPVLIKAMVITNPHNPLGRYYSRENLI
jgi:aspartate/methionine/tyrosine aminotransferase